MCHTFLHLIGSFDGNSGFLEKPRSSEIRDRPSSWRATSSTIVLRTGRTTTTTRKEKKAKKDIVSITYHPSQSPDPMKCWQQQQQQQQQQAALLTYHEALVERYISYRTISCHHRYSMYYRGTVCRGILQGMWHCSSHLSFRKLQLR